MSMQRVSTNLTLFYKFFVPIFWIVFFGSVTAAVLINPRAYYGEIPGTWFRIGVVIFFLSGLLMLLFTLMRLKRVEMSHTHLYVTNYFKHIRYPLEDIDKIQETEFLIFKIVTVYLKSKGTFGRRFTFLASRSRYADFWRQHPEVHDMLTFSS